jgi:hypothetical protein
MQNPWTAKTLAMGCGAAVAVAAGSWQPAQAILYYNVYESGGGLVVETSGELQLGASFTLAICAYEGFLNSLSAMVCTGSREAIPAYPITGPSAFAGIATLAASQTSGLATMLDGSFSQPFFAIASSYVPGDPITSRATFDGQTLSSLGFSTPGQIGAWTLPATGDRIVLCVGPDPCGPTPVPAPLPLLGLGATLGWARRLRQRLQLRSSAATWRL